MVRRSDALVLPPPVLLPACLTSKYCGILEHPKDYGPDH